MTIQHDKTKAILGWFEKISAVPRESKNEAGIARWLLGWASENGFTARSDAVDNVVIEVPGTPGYENSPAVVLQGHMDMVCEKAKGSPHNFETDPIALIYEGDWLRADDTTLGADNGIAIAMAMVAAVEKDVPHPPLELLFTVDEETGLTGANALEPGFINGKILLNIDSEDEGVFTVGCAGGRDTHIRLPLVTEQAPAGSEAFKIVVEGLHGGHSGIDIPAERGNSIRITGRALDLLAGLGELRIAHLHGGTAHNAIPRDAEAVVWLPENLAEQAKAAIARLDADLKLELANPDPGIQLLFEPAAEAPQAWSADTTRRAIDLLLAIPHGVEANSTDIEDLVETSNNLATMRVADGTLTFLTSQRSSVVSRLNMLTERIEAVGRLAGAAVDSDQGYPPWQPNMDSALLARCKSLFENMFDRKPVVEVIHAGLECGIIGDKYPGMDMISIGPTIKDPHSPRERIQVSTIGQVWDFLAALLADLK